MRILSRVTFLRPRQPSLRGRRAREIDTGRMSTTHAQTEPPAYDINSQAFDEAAGASGRTASDISRHGPTRCSCRSRRPRVVLPQLTRLIPAHARRRRHRHAPAVPSRPVPDLLIYTPLNLSDSSTGQSNASTQIEGGESENEQPPSLELQSLQESVTPGDAFNPPLDLVVNNSVRERYLSGMWAYIDATTDATQHAADRSSTRPRSGPHIVWLDEVQAASRTPSPRRSSRAQHTEAVSAFDIRDLDEAGQPIMPEEELPGYARSSGLKSYYDATGMAHELDFVRRAAPVVYD